MHGETVCSDSLCRRSGWLRSVTPKLLRPLAFLLVFAWVVWLFWSKPHTQQRTSTTFTEPCRHAACRQLERQQIGRAKRTYIRGTSTGGKRGMTVKLALCHCKQHVVDRLLWVALHDGLFCRLTRQAATCLCRQDCCPCGSGVQRGGASLPARQQHRALASTARQLPVPLHDPGPRRGVDRRPQRDQQQALLLHEVSRSCCYILLRVCAFWRHKSC
jgi:hypothetical protein